LILCECDVAAGVPGSGGQGGHAGHGGSSGSGGSAGSGGRGGKGGPTNSNGTTGSNGTSGFSGSSGHSGSSGRDGNYGHSGENGMSGSHGTVLFKVVDQNCNVIEQSSTRYNVRTMGYNVRGVVDDNVFEPGEELLIDNIQIANDGGLTLPHLTTQMRVVPLDNGFYSDPNDVYALPCMNSTSNALVQHTFHGHLVPDVRPVMDDIGMKRLDIRTTIAPRATLLGRPFDASMLATTLTVQYPVRVDTMVHPSQMIRGERGSFSFAVTNISNAVYGPQDSLGTLSYRIFIDPNLIVTDNDKQITMIEGTIDSVLPQQTVVIREFCASVSPRAKFFERCKWRVELFLRGKKIEIKETDVRIVPNFVPLDDTNRDQFDVLFVTDSHITRREFLLYQRMFEGLGLVANCWDCERHGGFSVEGTGPTWVDQFKGKLIVMPARTGDDLQKIANPRHIISHFVAPTQMSVPQPLMLDEQPQQVQPVQPPVQIIPEFTSLDSGLVLIGGIHQPNDVLDHLFESIPAFPVKPHEMITYHTPLNVPTDSHSLNHQVCTQHVYDLLEKRPSREFRIFGSGELEKIDFISSRAGKAVVQELSLSSVERILTIPSAHPTPLSFDIMDMLITDRISIASKFFSVLYAIVQGLSVERKLSLINTPTVAHGWVFCDDTRGEFTIIDIVKATLYTDLKEEFSFKDLPLYRVQKIVGAVQSGKFRDESTRDALMEIFTRLSSEMMWRAWSPLHELFSHKQQLNKLRSELENMLLEGADAIVVRIQAKQEATKPLKIFSTPRPLQSSLDKTVKIYK
jgi:hypothetical protein